MQPRGQVLVHVIYVKCVQAVCSISGSVLEEKVHALPLPLSLFLFSAGYNADGITKLGATIIDHNMEISTMAEVCYRSVVTDSRHATITTLVYIPRISWERQINLDLA